jgi:hypothetical protein
MNRISDKRIASMEQKVSSKRAERSAKRKETIKQQQIAAEYHSVCVAAIVRAGNPKFDEPLKYAWERALKHFKAEVSDPFAPAPGWLLRLPDLF